LSLIYAVWIDQYRDIRDAAPASPHRTTRRRRRSVAMAGQYIEITKDFIA